MRGQSIQPGETHGTDIATQWLDELDLESLRFVVSPQMPKKRVAVDLGCGLGVQGIRFSMLGCRATLYDLVDIGDRIESVRHSLGVQKLEFKHLDLRRATPEDFPPVVGLAYSQRFIHHLRFEEASRLLAMLALRLCAKGRLFISASGLESELGAGYAHLANPVEQRFSPLAANMQEKHRVREAVCLYTVSELEQSVVTHGFTAIRTWTSPFGNVKGVFERV